MFSALKSAVGVSLSGEVKHAFPSFHAISAVDIDGANVRVSPALLRLCFSSPRLRSHANKRPPQVDMSRYRGKVLVVANVASK